MTLHSIDLFCGAGGLSLGLEAAGFESALGVDTNPDACATYQQAFPKSKVEQLPIDEINFRQWRGVDLVAGGPPCQPFSNGGLRLAAKDSRDMLPEFVRAVNESKPKAFILENVAGLLALRNHDYLNAILEQFDDAYEILPPRIVNAADYGVPQKRLRLVIIGVRGGRVDFPAPTHPIGMQVTSRSVLQANMPLDAPNPSKVVFAKVPDLRPSPYAGHLFNGGGRPINLNGPAPTILASAGGNKTHFVDEQNLVPSYHKHLYEGGRPRRGVLDGGRRLTIKESALLQSFPKGMSFEGSRSSQYTQIGNAVPPRLAEVIAASIARILN